MSDKTIALHMILIAVFIIAMLFIRRAIRYQKRIKEPIRADLPQLTTEIEESVASTEKYLIRYICLICVPFHSSKRVKIRPEYYEHIRKITSVIGHGDVSITSYIDKVLKAHFEDNCEAIEKLYDFYKRPVSQSNLDEQC